MVLKWGIVSAGKISADFAKAVSILSPAEHKVIAVAARDLARAEEFSSVHNIPTAYGDYTSLANDSNIDVVYVGNLNPQHFEVSKLMLEHDKHVLCEKPLTLNAKQTAELQRIAKERKKFLMEALWSRCFPAYEKLRELLSAGIIGDVLYVNVSLGNQLDHMDRISRKELGGGTVLDLGVYTIQFQQFIFHGLKAMDLVAAGHLNESGVDESVSAIITYAGGRMAVLSTHSRVKLPNNAVIIGTKGTITVPSFHCPTELITPSGTLKFDLPKAPFDKTRPAGFSYEVLEVGNCIKQGFLESPKITHAESLEIAEIMDKVRERVGVVYEEDLI